MPPQNRSDDRLLLLGGAAFLLLGGGLLLALLLFSQREHDRETAPRQAAPRSMVVAPMPEVEVGSPSAPPPDAPLAVEIPIPIPEISGSAPDHGSLPGRWGLPSAPVAIVVFDDFQCPFCGRLDRTLVELHERFPTQVEVYHRDLPLDFHNQARGAHIAARCAWAQDRFWAMHDLLFAHARGLETEALDAYARELGLDLPSFRGCLESSAAAWAVDTDIAAAQALGVRGTPTSFVNGQRLDGAQPEAEFVTAIEAALASRGAW